MAVDECCGSVVFAEQAAVDVVKPVTRDQPVPAGRTCETLRETMKRTPLPTILSTLHPISDQVKSLSTIIISYRDSTWAFNTDEKTDLNLNNFFGTEFGINDRLLFIEDPIKQSLKSRLYEV